MLLLGVRHGSLPCLRLADRNSGLFCKRAKFSRRFTVENSPSGNDERFFRRADLLHSLTKKIGIGILPGDGPHPSPEKFYRVFVSFRLHILRKTEKIGRASCRERA